MTDKEVWVHAYCAAIAGEAARKDVTIECTSLNLELDPDPRVVSIDVRNRAQLIADAALEDYHHRFPDGNPYRSQS